MGMFDKPQYLTGDNGFITGGDTFWLHNAVLDGTVTVGKDVREQVKLKVSHELDSEQVVVWTSGKGIVAQIARMDDDDRKALPMHLRLDQVPSNQPNPTYVLNPASAPPTATTDETDIPF